MSDTNFIFSIVIAVYNTEKYLAEAIDSIINQSFDFKNTQIVLVDDGSTDQSPDICKYYRNKYPNNIVYLYQENSGKSIARNYGIKFAKGKYLNFLDSEDKLELNALQDVYGLFEKYDDLIDVVVIPRYNFDADNDSLFLNYKYSPTRIVDIYEEFDFPQNVINSAFIRRNALTDRFNPQVIISEDSLLINKTILKKCKYGVVSTARYMYRKHIEQTSTLYTKKAKREYYIDRMEYYFKELINYSISKYNHVLKYIQSVLMHDIQWFFLDNTHYVLNQKDLILFYQLLKEVLQFIDDDIILSQKFLTPILEYHILNIKYDNNAPFEIIYNSNELLLGYNNKFFDNLTNHKLIITDTFIKYDLLYIKGFFDTYVNGINLKAQSNNTIIKLIPIEGEEIQVINHKASNRLHFITVLELHEGNNEISFNMSLNSHEYPVSLQDKSFNEDISIIKNKLIYNFKNTFPKSKDEISKSNFIKSKINEEFEEVISDNKTLDVLSFEQEIFNMNKDTKVSIIIPVFNPGNLLYRCLDSVINQSLNEIEIICVDDGSSDDSPKILDEYALKDSRFKVFHQENQGAGTARNYGINQSEGEFILFLDSDDWIEPDMCKKLYIQSKRLNSDLVIFDALWHTTGNKINTFSYFSKNEFKEDFKYFVFDYHFLKHKLMIGSLGVIWSKFYKTSFIKENGIKFPKHKIYNDVEFHFKTILLANNISYLPEPFYHYIKLGQPSLQTSFRKGKDELVWIDVLYGIQDILIKTNSMEYLRLEFINYCIYYSFDKLKNIDLKYWDIFLEQLKSFFRLLNPSTDELNELKHSNLNWYNAMTVKYLPIYYDLMEDNYQMLKLHLLEFMINDAKNNLENTSSENKDKIYNDIRDMFLNLNETEPINDLYFELESNLDKQKQIQLPNDKKYDELLVLLKNDQKILMLSEEIGKHKQELEDKNKEIDSLKNRKNELIKEINTLKIKVNEITLKNLETEKIIEEKDKTISIMVNENTNLKNQLKHTEDDLKHTTDVIEQQRIDLSNLKRTKNDLITKIDNCRIKETEYSARINELKNELTKKENYYNQVLSNKNNEVTLLKGTIAHKESAFNVKEMEYRKQLDNKNFNIQQKENELENKKNELDSLEHRYTKQLSKIDNEEYCIGCFKEELSDNHLEIEYLKCNNLIKKILIPFIYLYLILNSKPKELSLNLNLYRTLKDSKCFNAGFYLNNNKDLIESKWYKYFSLELHYVCKGFYEKREFNKKYFNRNSKKELLEYLQNCEK